MAFKGLKKKKEWLIIFYTFQAEVVLEDWVI